MTEQEWLAQSDYEKNLWIRNIFHKEATSWKDLEHKDYLNWRGFGMIVEKDDVLTYSLSYCPVQENYKVILICDLGSRFVASAPTPWEAAALSYGKMRGLIE